MNQHSTQTGNKQNDVAIRLDVVGLFDQLKHVNSIVQALEALGCDSGQEMLKGCEVSLFMELISEKLEPLIATLSDHLDNERKRRIAKEREALGNVEQSV